MCILRKENLTVYQFVQHLENDLDDEDNNVKKEYEYKSRREI